MSKEESKKEKRSKKHEKHEKEVAVVHHMHNGIGPSLSNGHAEKPRVVCSDMCCFCFDILICHLTSTQSPRNPYFTNEE